jgi:hypothetical protein
VTAVYKPKRKGEASKYDVCEFVYQGKRFQESTGATSKTVAKEYEKLREAEMERAAAGLPTQQNAARIRTVNDVVGPKIAAYKVSHRPKVFSSLKVVCHTSRRRSAMWCCQTLPMTAYGTIFAGGNATRFPVARSTWRSASYRAPLAHVARTVAASEEARRTEGRWTALSHAEQQALLGGLKDCQTTSHLPTVIPLLMLIGMRVGEALSLTCGQVDLTGSALRAGRAKSSSGTGRTVPINDDLASVLAAHRWSSTSPLANQIPNFILLLGVHRSRTDPTGPLSDLKHGWETLRDRAGVSCRLHDLRHTSLLDSQRTASPRPPSSHLWDT